MSTVGRSVMLDFDQFSSCELQVEVLRARASSGYERAELVVHVRRPGIAAVRSPWRAKVNQSLLQRGVRSISPQSEVVRFGLDLFERMKKVQGGRPSGMFDNCILDVVMDLDLDQCPEIQTFWPMLHRFPCDTDKLGGRMCRREIAQLLKEVRGDLERSLAYETETAQHIFASTMSLHLDEWFRVTERRNMGWR